MIEMIDRNSGNKVMAMVLCGLQYQNDNYVIYCVRRDKEEANVFVSKLVRNSQGYTIDNNFSNGEKNILEDIVQKILSKTNLDILENQGFSIIRGISLNGVNYFDIEECYITTISRKLIKDCMIYYHLVSEEVFKSPVVEIVESKKKFNEGFVSNLALIIFGICLLIFCGYILIGVFFK